MAEVLTGINGAIIKWAREYYNMSIEDAAVLIGVDIDKYIKWESGEDFPTYAKLKKISNVFHKPSAVFFFPIPPHLPEIKGDLRTLSAAVVDRFSKNVMQQFERAKAYQIYLRELYGTGQSILSNRELFPKDMVQLCNYIRQLMAFPLSAQKGRKSDKVVFEIFRDKLYTLGVYVFKDSFKDDSVSGLCLNDDEYPIIIINNSMSFARQTFTLFHELYHLISNTSGAEIVRDDFYEYLDNDQTTTEKACDTFANEFLVPSNDFQLELERKELTELRIAELASLYSVSKEAIMYKLYKMKIITPDEYNSLKEIFYGDAIRNKKNPGEEKNGGGNYYLTKLSYLGQRYTGDVFNKYFSGVIDSVRACEMLNSKIDHLPKLEASFFRGVK
ncbi:MAG: ImmA/IrrE family metallo-endopeptidase [Firmicutes bacterium]|nr:ImmA/IrrE family metallo-endopeptidase [Bacillota bacterium]MBR7112059.1 ImmA/IrrE family metallo-endopeptidase [Clostridia bacterium]